MKTIKKIICPVDVYDFQPEAAEYAATLAKALGAEIIVLHVMEPLPLRHTGEGYSFSVADYEKREQEVRQDVEAKLAEIAPRFADGSPVTSEAALGEPAGKVLQIAKERAGDMIVMASHGRSLLGRAIYGSVTNKVLANAKIPVLVINPAE